MSQHAPLPPSGAACWVKCGMYRSMLATYGHIQEESDAAREGTAAHWVWEQMARGSPVGTGTVAPNGVLVTDEMLDGAELMQSVVGDASGGNIESRVSMPAIHPDNWGTPDFWDIRMGVVRVIDYKFGHGYVDVFENWQLMDYAAGVIEALKLVPENGCIFELVIVQPRCFTRDGTVRKWRVSFVDLLRYIEELRAAAHATEVARTSSACEYCPGRAVCAALLDETQHLCDWATIELPLEMTPDQMGREYDRLLRAQSAVKARIGGIEEMILHRIRSGLPVDGWGAESKPGRRAWSVGIEEVVALGTLMGVPLAKPAVITPTQAIKAGIPEPVVANVSTVPQGELKLVRVDTRTARKVFSQGES